MCFSPFLKQAIKMKHYNNEFYIVSEIWVNLHAKIILKTGQEEGFIEPCGGIVVEY